MPPPQFAFDLTRLLDRRLASEAELEPAARAAELERVLQENYGVGVSVPILRMLENDSREIKAFADFVYKNVFENYTIKQWGLRPEQLGAGVTGRVPVRLSRDDRYFQDTYQAMPKDGFAPMFQRMVAHPNITVELSCDYANLGSAITFDRMVYSGTIDSFFRYIHGELPYRSLRFEWGFAECEQLQPVAVVNYPNDHADTRITEFKHVTGQQAEGTSTVREYPQAHQIGKNEPYYAVPIPANADLYARYAAEAAKLKGSVAFAGRLADYRYYNMDQAVARALALFANVSQPCEVAAVTAAATL